MDFDTTAEVFRALGDSHRLKALHFLATAIPECCQGPEGVCACDLVTHLGLSQPTVSHHMKLLTGANLVTATRQGRWVHYALSAEGFQQVQSLMGQLQAQVAARPVCPLAYSPPLEETAMTQTTSQTATIQATVIQTPPNEVALTSTTQTLIDSLRTQPQIPLEFWLSGERLIGPGYHVTEIKAVSIESVDCGGQAASWRETVIQLMDGSAQDAAGGFMSSRKFLAIYDRVTSNIPVRAEAEVRFEYGNAVLPALQYHVSRLEAQPGRIIVHLSTPGVQCKAGEACGLPSGTENTGAQTAQPEGCSPASGCCTPSTPDLIALS